MMKVDKKIKEFLKKWLPPAIVELIRRKKARPANENGAWKVVWSGDYGSWEEAKKVSGGYDALEILNKVKEACLKVKKGEAIYERDSVLFDEIQYSWPILAALMWISAQCRGELNIVDFGGSLGTTYFQNKRFLDAIPKVRWNIVEQRHFVDEGKKHFEDDVIKFFYDIETCVREISPAAILLSSVVQYLPNPYQFLEKVRGMKFKFILFDRTPFVDGERDILTVQKVSPEIYPASYPCWFFSRKKFYAFFENEYELIARFEALDRANIPSTFEGCILRKKA